MLEIALLHLKEHRLDLGLIVLEGEVHMTGGWSPETRDLASNADKGKTTLQHRFDGAGQLGNGKDFLAGLREHDEQNISQGVPLNWVYKISAGGNKKGQQKSTKKGRIPQGRCSEAQIIHTLLLLLFS
ncbi:MAG: hypothetical protein D3910_18750 [Candidatus Electrothrix sp. ATG2]|nr:hypothetical protein [Candidatus Electrothrix sp. ATG2]